MNIKRRVLTININNQTRCINSNQYTLENILNLCNTTNKIKSIASTSDGLKYLKTILSDKRAILYFKQPSTRTFFIF